MHPRIQEPRLPAQPQQRHPDEPIRVQIHRGRVLGPHPGAGRLGRVGFPAQIDDPDLDLQARIDQLPRHPAGFDEP
ncbi:hypothetical protein KP696_31415 [Nocardia seriolae]|nr:hypothetical protein [Nocardia seriolae]OJF81171.1 hypothetical protein NS14008_20670 [Nocardia seriolae]QOW37810.1 hypothetical protein IMZ23_07540 [Nocardia seriolae]QUN22026.1 hypothetical protein KEC46_37450 [Nocardia seriolae]WKY49683.1 hypothetical protein Q5P07_21605 [Nocardia seriolae]WNJ62089.1 hypothetical protein RMO66_16225 [Nocardia seriolae]